MREARDTPRSWPLLSRVRAAALNSAWRVSLRTRTTRGCSRAPPAAQAVTDVHLAPRVDVAEAARWQGVERRVGKARPRWRRSRRKHQVGGRPCCGATRGVSWARISARVCSPARRGRGPAGPSARACDLRSSERSTDEVVAVGRTSSLSSEPSSAIVWAAAAHGGAGFPRRRPFSICCSSVCVVHQRPGGFERGSSIAHRHHRERQRRIHRPRRAHPRTTLLRLSAFLERCCLRDRGARLGQLGLRIQSRRRLRNRRPSLLSRVLFIARLGSSCEASTASSGLRGYRRRSARRQASSSASARPRRPPPGRASGVILQRRGLKGASLVHR